MLDFWLNLINKYGVKDTFFLFLLFISGYGIYHFLKEKIKKDSTQTELLDKLQTLEKKMEAHLVEDEKIHLDFQELRGKLIQSNENIEKKMNDLQIMINENTRFLLEFFKK